MTCKRLGGARARQVLNHGVSVRVSQSWRVLSSQHKIWPAVSRVASLSVASMAAKTQVVRRLNRQQMSSPSLKKEMREEIIGKRVSPELWGVKEAVEWVEKLIEANKDDTTNFVAELQELRDAFEKHSVTGRVLQLLDKEGLRELGLNSYVHCARLLSALEITRAQAQAEGTKRPGIFASCPMASPTLRPLSTSSSGLRATPKRLASSSTLRAFKAYSRRPLLRGRDGFSSLCI